MSSFDGASLNDLRAMIANADPSGLDAVASKWSAVHEALRQAQEDLLHHTLAATNHWQGAAADAFSARADELHQSLGNGAGYAFNASSGVSFAADSLRGAQAAMPAGALSLEGIAAAQQATTAGATAAQFDDRQRQQAAAVMRRLEEGYAAAGEMIGLPSILERGEDRGLFSRGNAAVRLDQMKLAPSLGGSRGGGGSPYHPDTTVPPQAIRKPQPSVLSSESPDTAALAITKLLHDEERPPTSDTNPTPSLPSRENPPAVFDGSLTGSSHEIRSMLDPTSRPDGSTPGYSPPALGTFRAKPVSSATEMPPSTPGPTIDSPAYISESHPLSRRQDSGDPSFSEATPEIIGGIQKGNHALTGKASTSQVMNSMDPERSPAITANGSAPLSTSATRRPKARTRPAYLIEDSESWLPRQPTNPPVIT